MDQMDELFTAPGAGAVGLDQPLAQDEEAGHRLAFPLGPSGVAKAPSELVICPRPLKVDGKVALFVRNEEVSGSNPLYSIP